MAKRFTDTNKYKNPFIRGLQGPYKVLWDYLYHDCDHAGIWIVDFEIAQIYVGADLCIGRNEALGVFNSDKKRIIEINNGEKWFIPGFIEFQYGKLNKENRAHKSVIDILTKNKIKIDDKGLVRSLEGCKDKDKDKDKDLDKDKEFHDFFEKARKIYPGKKRGHKTELENFIKKHKDWKQASEVMESSVTEQIADKEKRADAGLFVAEWKNFGTWINQRCWEEEPGEIKCPSNNNQSTNNGMI